MRLPIQSQPVQRTVVGRPGAGLHRERGNGNNPVPGYQGVQPNGVEPSFDFTSLIPIATTILSML